MVVHNPNNWHWVDKNCLPWSKEYFTSEFVNTEVEKDSYKFTLSSVNSVEGDCDVTQRKGRVLCIYDMTLTFGITGSKDEESFSGTITVPEFIHDQEEDDYVFNVSSESCNSEIKSLFLPVLKQKLMKFQGDLIKAHEKDVQHTT
ncbi:hypothetical protein PSN45_000965 [Yamadazyma tenuis]|uniref:Activator of Hsp90 ATPase AHSA1-like N-terminal domain-containing protein n=1 Tax=Candida tenuis (strain ATCC 10573 / BCRC 21748 / CBS 615 / JCM 9827 / NBRC 10315 / NRRL Y-1498 / VKM Y-70) TaxID=590646 RepID=G3B7C8_CANTC|nr:uncharacterized protein CANTEDRAFT_136178 [Yamadazyma tenuis ATCC 10573]EGV62244.1 hypothetical protein CANTEDRAFT_136178 [Yamadazyma tenuis ATCC 10573]WEJ93500.1 hypothetical protein PSN45_000965 [Yamadazyma tenuis]